MSELQEIQPMVHVERWFPGNICRSQEFLCRVLSPENFPTTFRVLHRFHRDFHRFSWIFLFSGKISPQQMAVEWLALVSPIDYRRGSPCREGPKDCQGLQRLASPWVSIPINGHFRNLNWRCLEYIIKAYIRHM